MIRAFFAFALCLLAIAPAWGAPDQNAPAPKAPRHVLLLHSSSQDNPWVRAIQQAVEDELAPLENNIHLHTEYMDADRLGTPEALQALRDIYDHKYSGTGLKLIMTSGEHALKFVNTRFTQHPYDTPVVFCGISEYSPIKHLGILEATGVTVEYSIKETVGLIRRLQPELKELLVVNDSTKDGQAIQRSIQKAIGSLGQSTKVTYTSDTTLEQLPELVRQLPKDSAVLLGHYALDTKGQHANAAKVSEMLAQSSMTPVYCLLKVNIKGGVLGGRVVSGRDQGQAMALIVKRILAGETADSIPVVRRSANVFQFDYAALQRLGITQQSLPPGSVILNKPFSFYREYRALVFATLSVFIILATLAILLARNVRLRRKTEKHLRLSEERNRAVFKQTLQFIAILSPEGVIQDANLSAVAIAGVKRRELVGEMLWDGPWWAELPDEQGRIRWAVELAAKGQTVRFETRQKWSQRPTAQLDFSIKPAYDEVGSLAFLIAEGRDISALKQVRLDLERSRFALENSADAFFLIDRKSMSIVDVNEQGCRSVGYMRKEFIGLSPAQFMVDYDTAALAEEFDNVIERRTSRTVETTFCRKDNTRYPVEISLRAMAGSDGHLIIALARNITERKQADVTRREHVQFVEALLEAFPTPVFYNDTMGRYLGCNTAFAIFVGKQTDDIVGRRAPDIWASEYAKDFNAKDKGLLATGSGIQVYEYTLPDRTGDMRDVIVQRSLFLDAAGEPAGIVGAFTDVTDLKRSAATLRELRNYLQATVDSMPSVLVGIDPHGFITQWNHKAQEVTGLSADMAMGQELHKALPWLEDRMTTIRRALNTRQSLNLRMQRASELGPVHEDLTLYPLTLEGLDGAVVRIDDITERMAMEQTMVHNEKMLTVGGLATGMAHEINNPLAGILQGVQNLVRRLSPELKANQKIAQQTGCDMNILWDYAQKRGVVDLAESIRKAGMHTAEIVNNMLAFSHHSDAHTADVDLVVLIECAISLALNDYDATKNYDFRKIQLIRDYDEDLLSVVCAPSEIEQVILNLLRNAGQAMAEDRPQDGPRITIGLQTTKETAIITVADNGPGMDMALARKVFDPFYTTKDQGTGTGLGLSVAYYIITNNHGGEITVDSVPGQGTRFIVRLPRNG